MHHAGTYHEFRLPVFGSNHVQGKNASTYGFRASSKRFGFLNGIIYNGCERIPGFAEERLIERHRQPRILGQLTARLAFFIFLLSPGVERGAFAAR